MKYISAYQLKEGDIFSKKSKLYNRESFQVIKINAESLLINSRKTGFDSYFSKKNNVYFLRSSDGVW